MSSLELLFVALGCYLILGIGGGGWIMVFAVDLSDSGGVLWVLVCYFVMFTIGMLSVSGV